ncbi:hypothetical protein MRB53_006337 [Persea americana]|uniref:Uncharacterized protein n=1 Tax=Persea americana TaxID=3435 RepID=A0ACC2MFV2_PERAE|nr:hypothetical protein MRB53_006337 [Persea americana]
MFLTSSLAAWIHQILDCMGGCLGCCTKATPIIAVDEPSKGLKIQGRTVRKPSLSEDFWSTSTYEMENSGVHSQRSLLLWTQSRQQWIGNRRLENRVQQGKEPKLRTSSNFPFQFQSSTWLSSVS